MRDAQHASHTPVQEVRVTVDGHTVAVPLGATVAAALAIAATVGAARGARVSVRGEPRTMFCGMGVCQECRVTIDGRAHRLACQTLCCDGQRIETTRTE
ncbi:2Fe-2S iron-sulfur cluster-binding protein [Paraburkholderia kururiensis]|uniref:2Fe-2S iron-sulfur cluster-binding protein n=1 Tax=Paraburkholderia kururiensis TaxID=984307 RepID=A0ABZ0WPU2_9BURK|nr:2Fe-2S iron-sulfur cluster-binding protein [Paraburkholderia kururiensis]WQD79425.1 2Fe-2S iron-sulfur cluster-binding protein [Paraburkholderia kururiensis]